MASSQTALAGITLGELAELVGAELRGDPTLRVTSAWPLDDAVAGSITLIDHADRYARLADSGAAAAVIPLEAPPAALTTALTTGMTTALPTLAVASPHAAFREIVARFRPPAARPQPGVAPSAVVSPTATVSAQASIGAGVVIGARCQIAAGVVIGPNSVIGDDCQIGADSFLAAAVVLYPSTVVGQRCRLHSHATLGADGFGYQQEDGRHVLVAQLGNVEVADDVEIGAGTTIDRGVYGPTRIGTGTKIDNLVQIGHNCRLGQHNLICSQVGIAGSTTTGDYVVMAGQVGVRDHVHIGTGATLSAMAGVSNNVPDGEIMLGAPATPLRQQKLQMAAVAKLPQLRKECREMRRQLDQLLAAAGNEAADSARGAADRAA
ncbi:UDP-3-O-(3-hydroxymyristoyl)glucosamine N-acyltransferase [Botrimarina hoheduenensis]|uniref:UDP-3-O-acylglucosamine N-acyltransferase n=1 Tax=Botrimarina hoheduenensis TaxID=2528000 RepID=A0A5C5VWC3_9BACT|nr:UDP-3-O-(3-hydroxymyristoyl)glucosamine N-acyltransferase [Botrimarina hoheduenensis]TWT42670.1 UDP-3-O-acylglucosamine N-acyltransferase [Botrimarina hoheduenensis]